MSEVPLYVWLLQNLKELKEGMPNDARECLQEYIAHMKTPTPLGLPWDPRHWSYGGAFAHEVPLHPPKVVS